MPEYVSIYDRPKKSKGRPRTCKLSDEEKDIVWELIINCTAKLTYTKSVSE